MKEELLKDIAAVVRGVTFSKSEGATSSALGRVPVIRAGSIQESLLVERDQLWVPAEKVSSEQFIRKDDILMCTSSGSARLVGKSARAVDDWDGSFGAFCTLIRGDHEKCDASYLFHFLNSPKFRRWASSSSGANIKNIRTSELSEFVVPLPTMGEQKRIATILDKADAIRRKRQRAIQLVDDFLRAVFLDMFGDAGTNPKGWKSYEIGELIEMGVLIGVQDGNHGNDHPKVADFVDSGIPFVTANVVRRGRLLLDHCYHLDESWLEKLRIGFAKPRDVVITHKGTLGETVILDESNSVFILSPQSTYYRCNQDSLMPEYLKAYFDTKYFQAEFKREGEQSTRAYIGITRQKNLEIFLPPPELQKTFQRIVCKVKTNVDLIDSADELDSLLSSSLTQTAFSGVGL